MNNQLREKLRDDPETMRRLTPALMHWDRPRFVLRRLNTWSPKYWHWYWYWYCADDIPEEYVNRILEERDFRI